MPHTLGSLARRSIELIEPIEDFSELGQFLDQPLKTYSTGMRARLGFSIAVHTDPDILLLDEVLSVGDADFQEKSRHRLSEMMNRARAIVVVSHQRGSSKDICSKVLWLEKGHVRDFGEPEPVIADYHKSTVQPRRPAPPPASRPRSSPSGSSLVAERVRGPQTGVRSRLAYLVQRVRDLYEFRYLVRYLASSALQVERVSFAFGFLWWLLDPLLMIAIWTVVIVGILGRGHGSGEPLPRSPSSSCRRCFPGSSSFVPPATASA